MTAPVRHIAPAHDLDAEAAVLSALLLAPSRFAAAASIVSPSDFYSTANRRIAEVIWALVDEARAVDITLVAARLRERDLLQEVGGTPYLAQVQDQTPAVANVEDHARIVAERARRRRFTETCRALAAEAVSGAPLDELLDRSQQSINDLSQTQPKPSEESISLVTLKSLLGPAIERAERRQSRDDTPIPVPFAGWRESLGGGLWPGAHFIVSGTGLGKSQLTLQTAVGASKAKIPTAYIGLELDEASIALRAISSEIGARWSSLYLGRCSSETLARAKDAMATFEGLPFYVDFGPPRGWPASRLQQLAQSMRKAHPSGPMLMVLDYLQLVGDEADTPRRGEMRQRVADAAYVTRDVARRFDAAVVVVSSAARNHYGLLASDVSEAGLTTSTVSGFTEPVRTIAHPHVLIGLGKESGDLEFSADTVTVLVRWPMPLDNGERAVLVAVPKVRAGFERWSALAFDGGRFVELDVRDLTELPGAPTKAAKGGRPPNGDDLRGVILAAVEAADLRTRNDIVDATQKRKAGVLKAVTDMLADGSLGVIDGRFRDLAKLGTSV